MRQKRLQIGVLGGTFDPVHYGHLRLAQTMLEVLALDWLYLIPAGTPPHRPEPIASSTHRLAMLQLAAKSLEKTKIDTREIVRSGPSYMVDTLVSLRQDIGEEASLSLILGIDAAIHFASWHRWQSILNIAHLVVVSRPRYSLDALAEQPMVWQQEWQKRLTTQKSRLQTTPAGGIWLYQDLECPIAATEIRQRIQKRQPVTDLLPRTVIEYIQQERLYS